MTPTGEKGRPARLCRGERPGPISPAAWLRTQATGTPRSPVNVPTRINRKWVFELTIKLRHLMAVGAATAVMSAPSALAESRQTCTATGPIGTNIVCSNSGNVQINSTLPGVGGFGGLFSGFRSGLYLGGPYAVPFAR